ncbi:MAG: DNA polymerase III subunit gamma/tau [Anaerolineae bacterium]|nr:DNA polymerase III subunit gamma/tau [Anaerolineae bacterium]
MPEQALYLKWRPTTFDDVVGQEHIVRTLRNALKAGRIRHAYLFSGPRGTGKTTMARLLAKAVNCHDPEPNNRPCNQCPACIAVNEGRYLDLIEIDAATHTGVDDVRDLREKIAFAPGEGQYKIYIIDEVHRFSGSAFDALLKTLEEPPEHAIFVLATTEIDKVPATIKSRCLQFEFRRLSLLEATDRLQEIVDAEGLEYEREALEIIARYGTGSMRDSISLLDQIITDPDEAITTELAQQVLGSAGSQATRALVETILAQDTAAGLRIINDAVDGGADPRQFGQQVVEHLRSVLIAQTAGVDMLEASQEDKVLYTQQSQQIDRALLVQAIRAFNDAINNYRGGWQPQLTLELALMDSVRPIEETFVSAAPVAVRTAPVIAAQPDRPAPISDANAVVAATTIQAQWINVLKAMYRYNKQSPSVMENFRVQRVEGGTVFLATDNVIFYERVNPFPEKKQIVERALTDVFKTQLKVQIVLIAQDGSDEQPTSDDPLLSEAFKRGGKIRQSDEPAPDTTDDED